MNNTSSKNSMQEFHDDTILSYKDFVIKYDIVSLNTSLDVVDYCYSFLCFLQEMGIQERYQFVFPLFYDFSISKGVENRDLINLSNKEDRAYYWLIDPSIIEDVEKHSEYGLGITDSYCNSNIGPSFLEITKEDENTITVSANLYKNLSFEDAFLYISKIKDFDNGRVVQEVIGARNGNARLEDIDSIDLKFVFDEENNSEYHLLEKNIEFKNGIKSHYGA